MLFSPPFFPNNTGELRAFLLKERKKDLQNQKARLMLIMVKHFFFNGSGKRAADYTNSKGRLEWSNNFHYLGIMSF